jgi:hypothetical protein
MCSLYVCVCVCVYVQMVEKIVARAKEQHSRRIQRTWHKYYDKVIRRRKAEETRKRLLAEADAEV